MKDRIVSLRDLMPDISLPSQSKEVVAPQARPSKVINDPTRTPVNKQTALLIAPASWIHKPMPAESLKPTFEKLMEENAILRAANQNLISENNALRKRLIRCLSGSPYKPEKIAPVIAKTENNNPKKSLLEKIKSIP